jgi:dimethylargininase
VHRRLALVRRPSPTLADGIVTHVGRREVDADLAVRQWEEYVGVLRRRGWSILEAPPADGCPDGVFIEDQVVVYGDVAVIGRSGAPRRRRERRGLRSLLLGVGYRVRAVVEPGTLDGGDVLKHGRDIWVGVGGRTNDEGVRQLEAALAAHPVRVHRVPVERVLHLKSGVTALPDGTVIGHRSTLGGGMGSAWPRVLEVPEEEGAHVVLIGGTSVLMSAAAPRTAQLLRGRGLDVVVVDISEFEKLEGCVTCLSVRLRG